MLGTGPDLDVIEGPAHPDPKIGARVDLTSKGLRPGSDADLFNLERLSRSSLLAWPGISTVEQLWNGFDSDDKLFMYPT